jgi:hypothetical protein
LGKGDSRPGRTLLCSGDNQCPQMFIYSGPPSREFPVAFPLIVLANPVDHTDPSSGLVYHLVCLFNCKPFGNGVPFATVVPLV